MLCPISQTVLIPRSMQAREARNRARPKAVRCARERPRWEQQRFQTDPSRTWSRWHTARCGELLAHFKDFRWRKKIDLGTLKGIVLRFAWEQQGRHVCTNSHKEICRQHERKRETDPDTHTHTIHIHAYIYAQTIVCIHKIHLLWYDIHTYIYTYVYTYVEMKVHVYILCTHRKTWPMEKS